MFYLCITSISRCCWHIVYRSFVHSYVVSVYRNPKQSFYSSPCYSICFEKSIWKKKKKILDSYFYGKKCNEEVNSKQTKKKRETKSIQIYLLPLTVCTTLYTTCIHIYVCCLWFSICYAGHGAAYLSFILFQDHCSAL